MLIKQQQGSTLIEILISMLILAIGVLGISSVQMTSMKNSNNSESRFRASLIVADMMARMQSNMVGVNNNAYDHLSVESNSSDECSENSSIVKLDTCLWGQKLAVLPNGAGTVIKSNDTYEIVVSWNEQSTDGQKGDLSANEFKMTMTL